MEGLLEDSVAVGGDERAAVEPATSSFLSDDHEGVTVLRLVGEHDLASAAALEESIDSEIAVGRNLVVSLQETEFMDSAIVAALYRGQTRTSAGGTRLVLHCGPDAVVYGLLQMTSLVGVVACAGTLDVALEIARS